MSHEIFMLGLADAGLAVVSATAFAFFMECFGKEGPMDLDRWLLVCLSGLAVWPFYLLLTLFLILDFLPKTMFERRHLRNCLPFRTLWV